MTTWILYIAVMGFLGWIYESFVMTIWCGRWENRGFLFGPFLPIYAVGGISVSIIFGHMMPDHTILQVFIVGTVGSAVLEYLTAAVLEEVFHQTWWDYSVCPFNVKGRICPPASIGFGIAALVVTYGLNPLLFGLVDRLPARIGGYLAVIYLLCFAMDLLLTLYNLKIREVSAPGYDRFNDRMDRFVEKHRFMEDSISDRVHRFMDERNAEE